ncbi:carbonic anhydrase [Terriglobus roseus DSM 18391]|uniref:Carbonic anhydrase n=1 Tax=Terriglobus roseus (strain DSM 18391 / NRRL B-41598 / KBS 63) TaxID=926566 RepID=I3ZKL9_TERRK|nr:carbonic anhydrase [Terriglobus roseus]AFL89787.1 carbonic anhydrase [Terriglobus roseus DSM 18391]
MQKLLEGYQKFQIEVFPKRAGLFKSLESGQKPSTLFLTCSDSRIVPDMILQSDPGELFISRNAGNIVPPYGEVNGGVTATIEYAVLALGVQNIVVCGHSDCGAMKAVLSGKQHPQMPTVDKWLQHSASAMQMVPPVGDNNITTPKDRLRTLTRANVLTQLQHLQTHPSVAYATSRGQLKLFGWVYEIHTGCIDTYDAASGRFLPLTADVLAPSVVHPRLELLAS